MVGRIGDCLLAVSVLFAGTSALAKAPPVSYCDSHRELCHRLTADERRHFADLLQRASRVVVPPPGYRCGKATNALLDPVGYGRRKGRAAPEHLDTVVDCQRTERGPRAGAPDIRINIQLSPLPASLPDDWQIHHRRPGVLVLAGPSGFVLGFGALREWKDAQATVHRGYPPSGASRPADEVVTSGPYFISAQVSVFPRDNPAAEAFVKALDVDVLLNLIRSEADRRRSDPEATVIGGALP